MEQKAISQKDKKLDIINIIKIILFVFISFYFLAYFYPFYLDTDSLVYGVSTINIASGSYEYKSSLLSETGLWEFVPVQWVKTIHETAIPKTGVGIYGFSTPAYLLGGYHGLLYLGPIMSIIFLIFAERVSTILFGRLIGLITLILLVSDYSILFLGRQLMTDNIFSLFFILGCLFLIKFLNKKKNLLILLCSLFFVVTAFIRIPGLIFLPIEITIVLVYFACKRFVKNKNSLTSKNNKHNNLFSIKTITESLKTGFFLAVPWIFFIIFFLSFNTYYFGDPLTTYQDASRPEEFRSDNKSTSSFLQFDAKFFEYMKFYSVSLLPDTINDSLTRISSAENIPQFEKTWRGLFSLLVIIPALIISIRQKTKRKEVIIFSLFILGWISFHSSNYVAPSIENPPTTFLRDRYMIPLLPLFFMLLGFIIERISNMINFRDISTQHSKLSIKSMKVFFLISIFVFLLYSINSSDATSTIIYAQKQIHDPSISVDRYPLDLEGLSESSIIVGGASRKTLEYNLTSFYPYWGMGRYSEVNQDTIPKQPIHTLKQIMEDGYDTFMFKGGVGKRDLTYFSYLEAQHGIVLKNYSKTFCKLETTNDQYMNADPTYGNSDETCYISTDVEVLCVGNRCFNVEIEWGSTKAEFLQ